MDLRRATFRISRKHAVGASAVTAKVLTPVEELSRGVLTLYSAVDEETVASFLERLS